MAKEKIELVSSKDSPTGVAGRRVDGEFNPNIISTAALSSQPDFNIPSVAPSTSVQGELSRLSGTADDFQSIQDDFARQQEERAKQAQSTEAQSFAALQAEILGAPTRSELESEVFAKKGGVDDLQKELNVVIADLRGEQRSLELRLRELDKNPEGLLSGALEDEKRRIQTESLQRQADISIIGMAVQDRFDSAKTIADRTINAITEQNQKRIDFYQAVYDRNSDLFDKAETRAFETAQADRKRKLDQEAAEMQTISDLSLNALQNGAPPAIASQMRRAKTSQEAIQIGGQYINKLDRAYKQAQIAGVYDAINSRAEARRKAVEEAASKEEELKLKKEADAEQALGIKQLALQIKEQEGLSAAVGFGIKKSLLGSIPLVSGEATAGTARADFEAQAIRLANMLTLDNLDLMSGVLSETDIKILETSGSNLKNFAQTEESYLKELDRVISTMNRTIQNNGVTQEQAAFYSLIEDSDINEIDLIFN